MSRQYNKRQNILYVCTVVRDNKKVNVQYQQALIWLENRASENTANPEENAVLDYLIGLVEADAKTAPVVVEAFGEQMA
ncbi:hypothetical protein SAMN02745132_01582 [Enterovibrio nigricans DSM 22720]|uniref:Uncharacterized protein n=1 Tax=Enterovibrio nigricans DSM 22720 TaxID=1121868 RepID=A0A1T4UEX3_9GAMM|nr:hypothetical protein SAMN02745132_01582 [Enterovibrio nigricans DSM 22720]